MTDKIKRVIVFVKDSHDHVTFVGCTDVVTKQLGVEFKIDGKEIYIRAPIFITEEI